MVETTKYDKAIEAIRASSKVSSIYVGSDSQVYSKKDKKTGRRWKEAKYSTVIILHHDSCRGAGIVFKETVTLPDYGNLRQRLMTEVSYAIDAALAVKDIVGDRNFEVHVDINPSEKHASSVAVKEAIGYVTGQLGFNPKVKPDAFAASHCSDHVVKNKLVTSASW